jgi:hypothetical protein
MRSICDTFRMTDPNNARAMERTVTTVRHALRWVAP